MTRKVHKSPRKPPRTADKSTALPNRRCAPSRQRQRRKLPTLEPDSNDTSDTARRDRDRQGINPDTKTATLRKPSSLTRRSKCKNFKPAGDKGGHHDSPPAKREADFKSDKRALAGGPTLLLGTRSHESSISISSLVILRHYRNKAVHAVSPSPRAARGTHGQTRRALAPYDSRYSPPCHGPS